MRVLKWLWLTMLLTLVPTGIFAQRPVVPLYAGTAPGSEGKTASEAVRTTANGEHVYSSIHHPSVTVYLPAASSATGVGVLVIPGGRSQ